MNFVTFDGIILKAVGKYFEAFALKLSIHIFNLTPNPFVEMPFACTHDSVLHLFYLKALQLICV